MKKSFPALFLFNNVFFPHTVLPLTVNDEVSKNLLLKSFKEDQELVFYHPGSRAKKIGTVGKILLLEYNQDSSMSVLVRGNKRVQLLQQEQHLPFPIFLVDDYFDRTELERAVLDDSLGRLYVVMDNWLKRHVPSVSEQQRLLKEMDTPLRLINGLSMLIIKDIELKEIFMENTSLPDRIRMMDALLRGRDPEIEDEFMSEAIKNFERLEPGFDLKNAI